ncbi:MAG: DNA-directed RNA polymerase subunit A' [DPANN group archaeon]|nr:DNA-directed RNA polymerase subunit A' [DPANN group archaeon]
MVTSDEPIVTKKIERIAFGVMSPSWIRKVAAVQVASPELYDADGYPVEKGLMDLSMGVIDPGLRCKVCGGRMKTCPGHFGYIQLAKPVLNILYVDLMHNLLRCFCNDCGRILMPAEKAEAWRAQIAKAKRENNVESLYDLQKNLYALLRKSKKCVYCNTKKIDIVLEKPTTFYLGDARLWPVQMREIFEKIPDEDLAVLGVEPSSLRPEWLVLTLLLVPPITIRPSITLVTGERSEDDLTHKLSDIIRVNQRLLENINAGAPEIIIEDLWDLLQYHITTYFDNTVPQVPPARHKTNRPLKTLSQRIKGKEGRIRYNLAGKRVNFCARSVITPDPFLSIDEVGVPLAIAREITIPERVTEWNKEWLVTFIKHGDEYPGATYTITPDGKRKKITEDTKEQIIAELAPGWIIERHLLNGDIVLFNRQPSLHKLSLMGHRVRIVPTRTLRIHPAVCPPYNADFDGDEMNIHLPQTEEAAAEAKHLLALGRQIITPRYGLSIIGEREDTLAGLYLLTKPDAYFSQEEVSDFLIATGVDADLPAPEDKKNGLWSGRQIVSLALPKGLSFEHEDVKIENGELKSGILTHDYVGAEGGVLIHSIHTKYGTEVTRDFINKMNYLGLAVVRKYPYSFSHKDLDLSQKTKGKIKEMLVNAEAEVKKIIKNYGEGKIVPIPGKSARETREAMILSTLNSLRYPVGELIKHEASEENNLIFMSKCDMASIINLSSMSGFAGQQALRGERIKIGFTNRTLSHFRKGEVGAKSRGFVFSGYGDGLDPVEMFFNAIVGRDSLMDTAMRTPKSGYMQRRLINALQDLRASYDGTVRDAEHKIVQFKFGGDNIDVSKSDKGGIDLR